MSGRVRDRRRGSLRARGGVDPQRIVVRAALANAAHVRRVDCADLALDTLPIDQHTIACDAL